MEDLVATIDQCLRDAFPGARTELEGLPPGSKVGGILVWGGFEGEEQIDRQRRLWKLLRSRLSQSEQSHVTAILTLTPDELLVMREG